MKYELFIFDMDGTILNTLEDLADSLNYALDQYGYPVRTMEEVRSFVGNGVRKLVERGAGSAVSQTELDKLCAAQKEYYSVHCADKTKPYDGICELLQTLRKEGCKTAVNSNKADYAVQALVVQYFDGLFDAAAGDKPDMRKKPAPDAVNKILSRLQVPRERAVYIGDSDVDIETARNARLDCISVDWGFRDREVLKSKGAGLIVSNPSEILQYV